MTDEKRFPQPRDEVGYREPTAPSLLDAVPRVPEPARPQPRHVIVTRPDEPELARSKAAMEDPRVHEQDARVAAREAAERRMASGVVAVLAWVARRLVARRGHGRWG